jgi:hypothetical protein
VKEGDSDAWSASPCRGGGRCRGGVAGSGSRGGRRGRGAGAELVADDFIRHLQLRHRSRGPDRVAGVHPENSGTRATGALTVSLAGSAAFSKTKDACTGVKLGPGQSCSVTVAYAPAAPGQADSAALTATSSKPAATASLALKGAGGKASPALATSASPGGTVGSTTVTDTAKLSGGFSPGGTIEFKLFGPSTTADCSATPVFDQTVGVSGDGGYTSPSFTPSQPGTYWWTARYGGDPTTTRSPRAATRNR